MPKKLVVFLMVLAVLMGGAAYFWFEGKPGAPADNPLKYVNVEKITTIIIENQTSTTTLQQQNGKWRVSQPVEDAADPVAVDRLMVALKSFSVGSIVSENPTKYPTFLVDAAQAGHVQVFVEGNKKVLDAYVGKTVTGQSDSFVRFEDKDPVYIASDLPNYLFRRNTKDFRLGKLLPISISEATAVRVEHDKKQWNLARSSDVWKNESDGKLVETPWIERLTQMLDNLFAVDFGSGRESPEELGHAQPYLKVTVETPSGPAAFSVGNKVPSSSSLAASYGDIRYAATEGRPVVLVIHSRILDDFTAHLKSSS